jgi:hypothetical protein
MAQQILELPVTLNSRNMTSKTSSRNVRDLLTSRSHEAQNKMAAAWPGSVFGFVVVVVVVVVESVTGELFLKVMQICKTVVCYIIHKDDGTEFCSFDDFK